jgi:hypothetical protein
MMTTMKLIGLLSLAGLAGVPALADLPDYQVRLYDSYGSTNGGEFDVRDYGADAIPFRSMVQPANGLADFVTFCIEKNEYVSYDTTYDVVLNTAAINGGVGGGNPDYLDARTAYLFSQFSDGTLSTYDFDNSSGNRGQSADELQEAIWYLEQEIGSVDGQAAAWVAEAEVAVAPGGSWYNTWGADSIGDVRVMNLYAEGHVRESDYNKQDQLVRIPAPGAALLGALGLAAIGALRRSGR